jgi:hypothetical protein
VALAVALGARWGLRQPGGSDAFRAALALAPLAPGLVYALRLLRWMRRLDELQRHIQVEAALFVAAVMGFAMLAVDQLQAAGFLRTFHWGWEFVFALTFLLWMIGCGIATRRYS